MNHSSRPIAAALAAVLALTAACAAESKRTESVTTTTDKGTSIAPPAKEAEKRNRALVRFVHAVPDGAAVDAFAGEAKTFPHLAYKTVTSYQELPEGQHTFRVRVSGLDSSPPLAAGGEGLSGGKHYTVITQPSTDTLTPTLRVVNDNLTPPSKGKAKVRIIHASRDAGAVDVYIKGQDQALFSGVSIQSESGYSEVEPMNATLEVHPPGQKQTVLAALSVRFDPDKSISVYEAKAFLTGYGVTSDLSEEELEEQMRTLDALHGVTTPNVKNRAVVQNFVVGEFHTRAKTSYLCGPKLARGPFERFFRPGSFGTFSRVL